MTRYSVLKVNGAASHFGNRESAEKYGETYVRETGTVVEVVGMVGGKIIERFHLC
jgi:hypothetical protein